MTHLLSVVAPAITTQPVGQAVTVPNAAVFSVVATGSPSPNYQWQQSTDSGVTFTNINGATQASYRLAPTGFADAGKLFRVVVSNSLGTVSSNAVLLTAKAAGSLATFPQAIAVGADGTIYVGVIAASASPTGFRRCSAASRRSTARGSSRTSQAARPPARSTARAARH